jgi:hypothetical protein
MNYNILNDYITKISFQHPYNQPKLSDIKFILSNNNVIINPKLMVPMINTSISITGQYPNIIKAKKSVAHFKLRKGGSTGLLTTLSGSKGLNYLKLLNLYLMPRLVTNQPTLIKNKLAQLSYKFSSAVNFEEIKKQQHPVLRIKGSQKFSTTNSLLTIGFQNVNIFSFLTPLEDSLQISHNLNLINPQHSTGGYTQIAHSFTIHTSFVKTTGLLRNLGPSSGSGVPLRGSTPKGQPGLNF